MTRSKRQGAAAEPLEVAERRLRDYAVRVAGEGYAEHMSAEQVAVAAATGAGNNPWWVTLLAVIAGLKEGDATEDVKELEKYVKHVVKVRKKFAALPASKDAELKRLEKQLHADQYMRMVRIADGGSGAARELLHRWDDEADEDDNSTKAGQYKGDAAKLLVGYWCARAEAEGRKAEAAAWRKLPPATVVGLLTPKYVELYDGPKKTRPDAGHKTNPGQWKSEPFQEWYRDEWMPHRAKFDTEDAARAAYCSTPHERKVLKDKLRRAKNLLARQASLE
jgi:hypothetical protein